MSKYDKSPKHDLSEFRPVTVYQVRAEICQHHDTGKYYVRTIRTKLSKAVSYLGSDNKSLYSRRSGYTYITEAGKWGEIGTVFDHTTIFNMFEPMFAYNYVDGFEERSIEDVEAMLKQSVIDGYTKIAEDLKDS